MSSQPTHNLDIHTYSFHEIMELFEIPNIHQVSLDDLKRAKKKVLMLHPDKSKLPPEYFLFYKKAFDVVIRMYDNVQKVSQAVEDQEYSAEKVSHESTKKIQKSLKNIPTETFHNQFNSLFEKHMKKPINEDRNAWFRDEQSQYKETITSAGQMADALDRIKTQQQHLVKYQGVQPIQMMNTGTNALYDDDGEEPDQAYVGSDIFSKLKYDDLRKVHKDQTVFSIRESDMHNVPQYRNVDEYSRARDVSQVKPMERSKAQQMMEEQEYILQDRMRQKQYQSELSTMKYADANKEIMANFLRIQH